VWAFTQFAAARKKIKLVPVHAMEAYRGSRGIAPLILNLRIMWT